MEALPASTSSPEASPARTFRLLAAVLASLVTDPDSGTRWREPFAYYDPGSCSSRTSPDSPTAWAPVQASLLWGPSSVSWPKAFTWGLRFACELPTWALLTSASASSSLLPTPSAYESTPTEEYVEEIREHLADPHSRLYLPGRKWHAQRTLSRIAGALLPTPTAGDASSSGSRNLEGSKAHAGVSLTDAIRYGNSTTPRLPTPTARDAKGPGARAPVRASGRVRGRDEQLTDLWTGAGTARRFDDGKPSSAEEYPNQLTIEDA